MEWEGLYKGLEAGLAPNSPTKPSKAEFFWAMTIVRSRTFSQPYIGSTLRDRLQLAIVVGTPTHTHAL